MVGRYKSIGFYMYFEGLTDISVSDKRSKDPGVSDCKVFKMNNWRNGVVIFR